MIVHPSAAARRRATVSLVVTPQRALIALTALGIAARLLLVVGREVQRYLPDEYLYSQLARSLAEGHGARVLGQASESPALLQPLLTAPAWLAGDPELAFRLTQALNAVLMGLGAVVVYALARRLGVRAWTAVAAAAVALASPDLLYAGYVTADALGYLLALTALYVVVGTLERPSVRGQALFLGVAGLAAFARLQYVALFVAAAVGAVTVERAGIRRVVRRHWLIVATPILGGLAVALGGSLGRYASVTSFGVSTETLRWIPVSAVLLAAAAGAIIAPGAVAWTASQLARPTSPAALAFASTAATLMTVLVLASALFATETGSPRFFERYLMTGIPLAAVCFCCWMQEGRPWRGLALGVVAVLGVAFVRVPVSEYAAGMGRADSPFLLGVSRLESLIGVGGASLTVSLALIACLAVTAGAAFGRVGAPVALGLTTAILTAVSLGAHSADRHLSHALVAHDAAATTNWVDRIAGRDVLLVQPAGSDSTRAMLLTLRNASISGIALLGAGATPFDGAARRLTVDANGSLELEGEPVQRQLLIDGSATRVVLAAGRTIGRNDDFTLVAPRGAARLAGTIEGLSGDGTLSAGGAITLYATGRPGACRIMRLHLSQPAVGSPVRVTVRGSGHVETVTVGPGETGVLTIAGDPARRTTARFAVGVPRPGAAPRPHGGPTRARLSSGTEPCDPSAL